MIIKQMKYILFFALALSMFTIFSVQSFAATQTVGDFTITGDEKNYSFSNGTLTITGSGDLTISGTTTSHKIVVPYSTPSANLTLDNLSIQFNDGKDNSSGQYVEGTCAIYIYANTNITLVGDNIMKSGVQRGGVQVQTGINLTIDGTGSLTATGGDRAAGIGGGDALAFYGSVGGITINGGTVNAYGGQYAAGIGSGNAGKVYRPITINGGTVTAVGGAWGAGIGTGFGGDATNIIINGGVVNASSRSNTSDAAGIGGGLNGQGGTIEINGGIVRAVGNNNVPHDIGNGRFLTASEEVPGVFRTSSAGNAFIFGSIQDTSNQENWNGIFFNGNNGIVHGNVTFDADDTGTIDLNHTLTVPEGSSITNNGTLIANGVITGNGVLTGSGRFIINNFTANNIFSIPDQLYVGNPIEPEVIFDDITYLDVNFEYDLTGWTKQFVNNASPGSASVQFSKDGSVVTKNFNIIIHTGDFLVTGGTLNTDYSFADNVLTIIKSTELNIRNIFPLEPTECRIVVPTNTTANIALSGVNIDVSDVEMITADNRNAAFDIQGTGIANITLIDNNILIGDSSHAGLQVPNGAQVTITGTGTLNATGGNGSAGIGAGSSLNNTCGVITINDGTVNAYGGDFAAGIGGASDGITGGFITINGGVVNATSSASGAGIGAGFQGVIDSITIAGGTVTANGGVRSAGIGGGDLGYAKNTTISGGTVRAIGATSPTGIIPDAPYDIGHGYGTTSKGVFSTGENGNAIIYGSIDDESKKSEWSAIIHDDSIFTVYSEQTFSSGFTLNSDETLLIPAEQTLSIAQGAILTNRGTLRVYGTLTGNGMLTGDGTFLTNTFDESDLEDIPAQSYNERPVTPVPSYIFPSTIIKNRVFQYTMDGWDKTYKNNNAIGEATLTMTKPGSATIVKTFNIVVDTGDFAIVGGSYGDDYIFDGSYFTVKSSTPLTISNADSVVTASNGIIVQTGISANLTLKSVNIANALDDNFTALETQGTGVANIILVGDNTLISRDFTAGLQVEEDATVIIEGEGSLVATGGQYGAGIGGGQHGTAGTIIINSGTVTASGGTVGIGAGSEGNSGGSFQTDVNGNAFIYGTIQDKTNQASWSGFFFENNNGYVYGTPTLSKNFTLANGNALTILSDATLTIPNNVALTNNGIVYRDGTLVGSLTTRSFAGDVNMDNIIDIDDLAIINNADNYNRPSAGVEAAHNSHADVNRDGVVNFYDLSIARNSKTFGR